MLFVQAKDKSQIIISLFKKPDLKQVDELLEKGSSSALDIRIYKNYESRQDVGDKYVVRLNEEFVKQYDLSLEKAYKDTSSFVNDLTQKEKQLVEPLFILPNNIEQNLFKYLSPESMKNSKYGILEGCIAFSSPATFNDPFDCNILFKNNTDMRELFRVLCLAQNQTNILMWSYYGGGHKGYCIERKANDINKVINNSQINGLCIVGEVEYTTERPQSKNPVEKFSYTDIKFYIDASFKNIKNGSTRENIDM